MARLTRLIFALYRSGEPVAPPPLLRSLLVDSEQPEKHLSGFKEALKCAAQAVGATELELSVDSSGCDVLSQHNLSPFDGSSDVRRDL